jgi:NAD+ kinase
VSERKQIAVIENCNIERASTVRDSVLQTLSLYPCDVKVYHEVTEVTCADIAIVLGGDGTILHAADALAPKKIPLLGINLGRVGYLAELEVDEVSLLSKLFTEPWHIEARIALDVTLGERQTFLSVNDAVIGNFGAARLVEIGARHNGRDIGAYLADALIISTPTGSTAYSMAAGGSVLDPTLDCISLTPVCPISSYAKPLIFSAQSTLEFENRTDQDAQLYLTVDGRKVGTLSQKEKVRICRSKTAVYFVHLKEDSFCNTLRNKVLVTGK